MIDVYFWPTGNGKKITIMLEEVGLPYNVIPVNINKGGQATPAYEAINPNNKMPALVDHDAVGGPSDEDKKRLFNLRDQDLQQAPPSP